MDQGYHLAESSLHGESWVGPDGSRTVVPYDDYRYDPQSVQEIRTAQQAHYGAMEKVMAMRNVDDGGHEM